MKSSQFTHLITSAAVACSMSVTSAIADDTSIDQAPPSVEEISNAQPDYSVKTETVYEPNFLPGIRLCKESEIDYRGGLRKVNCQDEMLINSVSTRKQDPYNTRPNVIVNDRIEPNGNILRINFRRKASVVSNKPNN